ncbi:MAG: DUF3488 and transglutaminase-like domain-containing protein [Acidimicrobiia bacterium]|nr:DUF3488 and transglutaminase-like domain-containing protein [Acidimicrobiia bacterium]
MAPVPVTDGAVFLAAVATWAVATAADLLAFRYRATIAAVLPGLALFALAAAIGRAGLRTGPTVTFAVAAAVFLLLQHQALLGHRRAWFASPGRSRDAGVLLAGAGLAAVAIAIGLLAGPGLPGAEAEPLLEYRSLGGDAAPGARQVYETTSPMFSLKADYLRQPRQELFTVRVTPRQRLYYRFAALDRFDGELWTLEAESRDAAAELDGRPPPGTVRQEFAIGAMQGFWVPAAYRPVSISLPGARVIPESGTLLAPQDDVAGLRYVVESALPPSSPDDLSGTPGVPPEDLERYQQLPAGVPEPVASLARGLTEAAPTPFEKAEALERFFTVDGGFTYTLDVPEGHSGDALLDFLSTRAGYCEQFAGTFAVMARSIGLPTRVAIGFTSGTYDPAHDVFRVTNHEAHVWAEVYITNLGWVPFEPTPASDLPGGTPTGSLEPLPEPAGARGDATGARRGAGVLVVSVLGRDDAALGRRLGGRRRSRRRRQRRPAGPRRPRRGVVTRPGSARRRVRGRGHGDQGAAAPAAAPGRRPVGPPRRRLGRGPRPAGRGRVRPRRRPDPAGAGRGRPPRGRPARPAPAGGPRGGLHGGPLRPGPPAPRRGRPGLGAGRRVAGDPGLGGTRPPEVAAAARPGAAAPRR